MDAQKRMRLRKRIDRTIKKIIKTEESLLVCAVSGIPSQNYDGLLSALRREHCYLLELRKTMPDDTGKLIKASISRITVEAEKDPFLWIA